MWDSLYYPALVSLQIQVYFQFSLWDSVEEPYLMLLIYAFTFNSLCEIQRGLPGQRWQETFFQFSLWDSLRSFSTCGRPSWLSILFVRFLEIIDYPGLLATYLSILFVRFLDYPFCKYVLEWILSILFVRFRKHVPAERFADFLFQFSLWDSLDPLLSHLDHLFTCLSILFVRFTQGNSPEFKGKVKWKTFNSLCEIHLWAKNEQEKITYLSILFVRFRSGFLKVSKITCRKLSILFVRFRYVIQAERDDAERIFQFSLWDSILYAVGGVLDMLRFQFSLWDSYFDYFKKISPKARSFNSLCEIPRLSSLPGSDKVGRVFQFSLWDSAHPAWQREEGYDAFNSLCEIPRRHSCDVADRIHGHPFNSLCEIRLWRYLWAVNCSCSFNSLCEIQQPHARSLRFPKRINAFQFSLWDSLSPPWSNRQAP